MRRRGWQRVAASERDRLAGVAPEHDLSSAMRSDGRALPTASVRRSCRASASNAACQPVDQQVDVVDGGDARTAVATPNVRRCRTAGRAADRRAPSTSRSKVAQNEFNKIAPTDDTPASATCCVRSQVPSAVAGRLGHDRQEQRLRIDDGGATGQHRQQLDGKEALAMSGALLRMRFSALN